MTQIEGRTAVVTAGGNGIGRAIGLALAAAGANLVVADIRDEDAVEVRDQVRRAGGQALAVRTDVTSLGDMQALTQAAFDAFGTVEILCNNAGVAVRPPRAIWDTSYADLKYMVDVNIWGLLHGYHVFIPRMRAQPGEKHIINTASMAAILSFPSQAIYTLTKSGMDGFSRVTDLELQADGFVTTVPYPGVVNTSAAQRSAEHRPPEDRQADAAVRPYVSYAAERGEPVFEIGAGRGAADVAKGGEPALRPIEPEVVGAMVVDAIRNNRRTCLTHPVAAEVFQERISAWMDGLKP